jgi:integrase
MAGKLSARRVETAKPGKFADGSNLYLIVNERGVKTWKLIYTNGGRRPELTLGKFPETSLSEARELALEARRKIKAGIDPVAERRAQKAKKVTTFGDVARQLHADKSHGWRAKKYTQQWLTSLERHAAPLLEMSVAAIDTDAVLAVLRPIWQTKHETASRLRGQIERVLSAAAVRGLRSGMNPAIWRGHLDALLSKPPRTSKRHHRAVDCHELPTLIVKLRQRQQSSISAYCLEFCVLTAARTGEAIGARWSEIDEAAAVWTLPAGRTKQGRAHRVPLTARALAIITAMKQLAPGEHVFPGRFGRGSLHDAALWKALAACGGEASVHGFRAAFRTWVSECTSHPRELAEMALGHVVGDATERAYARGDALERRRRLMEDWAAFLNGES